MRKYVFQQYIAFAFLILLMILDPIASSILNFFLQRIFNAAGMMASKMHIIHLLTTGFFIWMGKRIVITFTSGIKDYIICNVRADLKTDVFHHILSKLSMDVSNTSTGLWTSMFTNDITLIETRYINSFLSAISNIFSMVILAGSFLALNITLAAVILGFGILSLCVPIIFSKLLNKKSYEWSQQIGLYTQRIREFFAAFPTIKNYSVEGEIEYQFKKLDHELEEKKFDADFALGIANNSASMLAWFMQFIAISVGVVMMTQGQVLLGTVVAAQSFSSDIAVPLIGIVNNINSMRSIKSIVEKLKKMSHTEKTVEDHSDSSFIPENNQGLSFSHVFLELGGKEIIHDFTFRFENGKKYLIIGKNGSGKSSLFRMLCRYYQAASGLITINGRSIQEFDGKTLSHYVSYMNEDVALFSDKVENNILLYQKKKMYQLADAIKNAQLHLDLDRYISDNTQSVSSGERRRIEIARSLLSGSNILIFDEVISTLDTEAAYDLEKMVLSFHDHTIIQISHNFSRALIEEYDDILIIDAGHLCEHGTFHELIERSEYFRKICAIKFGGVPNGNGI